MKPEAEEAKGESFGQRKFPGGSITRDSTTRGQLGDPVQVVTVIVPKGSVH